MIFMKASTSFFTFLITLLVFTTVTYVACNKDACKGVICYNGGACLDGQCMCPDGYTGKNCETKKDLCTGIVCQNGGVCKNGVCECPDGYEGTFCEIESDPCMNIVCLNGGTCTDGKCDCSKGYEGKSCETPSKEKFLGVWTVFENGTVTNSTQYSALIKSSTVAYNLRIDNFYNKLSSPIDVSINKDSILIPPQLVGDYEMKGWGIINTAQTEIKFFYSIKDVSSGITDDFGLVSGEPSIWTK
jgi:hypothetical protein